MACPDDAEGVSVLDDGASDPDFQALSRALEEVALASPALEPEEVDAGPRAA